VEESTDCAHFSTFLLPVRVSLATTDGRFAEEFDAMLWMNFGGEMSSRRTLERRTLNGSFMSIDPGSDGFVIVDARFKSGAWEVQCEVLSKLPGDAGVQVVEDHFIDPFDKHETPN